MAAARLQLVSKIFPKLTAKISGNTNRIANVSTRSHKLCLPKTCQNYQSCVPTKFTVSIKFTFQKASKYISDNKWTEI